MWKVFLKNQGLGELDIDFVLMELSVGGEMDMNQMTTCVIADITDRLCDMKEEYMTLQDYHSLRVPLIEAQWGVS